MALLAEVAPTLHVCAHVEVTGCQPDAAAAAAVGVRRTDGEIATTDRQRKTESAALICRGRKIYDSLCRQRGINSRNLPPISSRPWLWQLDLSNTGNSLISGQIDFPVYRDIFIP